MKRGSVGQDRWWAAACAAAACLLTLLPGARAQDRVAITILYTNDLHAMLQPFEDEDTGQTVGGFSQISTVVQKVRRENEHVLLVDGGDAFIEDQHLEGNYFRGEPVVTAMNQIGYDLAVPGNHDFEFGLDVLARRIGEAEFPYLAANIVAAGDAGEAAQAVTSQLEPYIVIPVAGVRIGFLGLTQPLHNFSGIDIRDTVRVAQELVPILRQEADLVVLVTHQEPDRDTEILDTVEGIDLLLAAHEHDVVFDHGVQRNGTLLFKTSYWGREVGQLDLVVDKDGDGFSLTEAQARLLPVTADIPADPAVDEILQPYLDQAGSYRALLLPALIGALIVVAAVLVLLARRAVKEA